MDKMKMQTSDLADEKFQKLAALFPNAVIETIDENGEVVRAIDKDVLRQEINAQEKELIRFEFKNPELNTSCEGYRSEEQINGGFLRFSANSKTENEQAVPNPSIAERLHHSGSIRTHQSALQAM